MNYNYLQILDHMEYIPEETLANTVTIMKPKRIDPDRKVDIYFNLHKKIWSVRQGGKVIAHTNFIQVRDPQFIVNPKGRERVLREKKKNVHAFVRGYVTEDLPIFPDRQKFVSYNPYQNNSFVERGTENSICSSPFASLEVINQKPMVEALWY